MHPAEDFDFDAAYEAADPGAHDWKRKLGRTSVGSFRRNFRNACIALRDHPALKDKIAYDEFRECAYARGPLPWDNRSNRAWTSFDDLAATEWLQGEEVMVCSSVVREAVERVAYESRFHPVREWLDGLRWDGNERIGGWLTTYLGVQASVLSGAIGRKFLVAAVARVMRPGCKVDHVLILEGPQGLLKSTALRTLVRDDWYADQIADLGTKDSSQDLRGKWLIELSELSAIRPAEVERVKAYVSRQVDHYRASYGRRSSDVPRQTVFAGTTNAREYLSDSTGGRRFWPVFCTRIDIEALVRDRDQLWAEAVAAFHAGETWWLDDERLRRAAQDEQEDRRITDPWETIVSDWLEEPTSINGNGIRRPFKLEDGRVTNALILEHAIAKPAERQTTADQMRVGKILSRLGWRKRKSGRAKRIVWEKVETPRSPLPEASPLGVSTSNPEPEPASAQVETREKPGAHTDDPVWFKR